jgi:uncharacterized OB-fold protein
MKEGFDLSNCFTVEGKLALPYSYFAGRVGSRFLIKIRDQKKIMGVRCNRCKQVFVPPRQTCDVCMEDIRDQWVDVASEGQITNYTVVRYRDGHLPKEPPYVLAMILLDGADTSLVHMVEGVAPEQVRIGMRVRAVFAEKTTNTLLDIDRFEPV